MNILLVIPARYESSRFPGKPLADIDGKSLIERVWRQCCLALPSDSVLVATDDSRILYHCKERGMRAVVVSEECLTGTDRVYFAFRGRSNIDCIMNVQGDEPLISPHDIHDVLQSFERNPYAVHCGMSSISDESDFRSSSTPKVVCDSRNRLLYMSRAAIPTDKSLSFHSAKKQVCIYAFSPEHLQLFAEEKEKTPLEAVEDIEILRFLELGIEVQMVEVSASSIAVDYPEDIDKVVERIHAELL